jgi:diaminopimelate epimerase
LRALQFTKMQGLGNDFIVIDGPIRLDSAEIDELCDRRFGIGADGVLVVSREDPIRMEYWNADGSAAEMCGNGLRCVARYAYDKGWAMDRNFAVQTPIGVRGVRVLEDMVEAELGRMSVGEAITVDGADYILVDAGNPHAVAFVEDPHQIDVDAVGRAMQEHHPAGVNVEFAAVEGSSIRMRVWERGVGETMACGTGMAAAVAAAGMSSGPVIVEVPGGKAAVEIRGEVAWIRGPAEYSFRGSVGER